VDGPKTTISNDIIRVWIFNKKDDGSETKVTAGDNITVEGLGTEGKPYIIKSTLSSSSLSLEQVLKNGNDANGKNIRNVANPVDNGDVVPKVYVDAISKQVGILENI
jgi:hypothetical protein